MGVSPVVWVQPILFFMVSTHICPKYPPSLSTASPTPAPSWYILSNILFSLTFLSDLMKRLQYGCQRKLVNDFKMIYFVSAFPVLFNMYTDKDSNLISECHLYFNFITCMLT